MIAIFLLLAAAPGPVPVPSPTPTGAHRYDPNRMVCHDEEQLGTRLGTHRVCMTAAQWNEQMYQVRSDMDRNQRSTEVCRQGQGC